MESESGTSNTKVSDSGYSISCSNSNSQRSASSKSRHSGSNSSRSSGYCGGKSIIDCGSTEAEQQQQQLKRNKNKEHKKKKIKSVPNTSTVTCGGNNGSFTCSQRTDIQTVPVIGREVKSEETDAVTGLNVTFKNATQTGTTIHSRLDENKDMVKPTPAPINQQTDIPLAGEEVSLWNDQQSQEMVQEDVIDVPNVDTKVEKEQTTNAPSEKPEDGFCCVISIYDGVVLYTTPSLTTVLGFPKDMWLGRSFIDFIHPKDRETFSNQVTNGVYVPLADVKGKHKDVKHSIHVCLRKYRGLKTSGFGVVEKAVSYQTFHLTVTFKHVTDSPETNYIEHGGGMFLVVVAVPVHSSYKVPEETRKSTKFGMRHTASCIFTHVDPDVVTNFGFLPQDMLGKSVFDFYHPEDMPFLKEVYESVMQMCHITGSVFRSKPYRFAVQNGGFAVIETEWSSFVNPWSRRLEFVIGLHRVIQGPSNPDIFETPKNDETKYVSEEVLKESKVIQGEILLLLSKELPKPNETMKQEVSKTCKDLATFMESLMEEVSKSTLQLDHPQNSNPTNSERDSVMLGEISPHHDYYDSKSSSETPPSYNQLNYNENIQRFFQSKPKTTVSDESVDRIANNTDVEQDGKSLLVGQDCSNNQKCLSPIQNSGVSGSGSAGNLSSGSNQNMESATTSATNTSNDSYKPPHLTEELLSKHNEDMEKMMIQRHREQRFVNKDSKKHSHKYDRSGHKDCKNDQLATHGVKRSVSHSWEGDNHKISKHKHQTLHLPSEQLTNNTKYKNRNSEPQKANGVYYDDGHVKTNDVNLWPPFSVTVTPLNNTHACNSNVMRGSNGTFATGMLPVYYIPAQQHPLSRDLTTDVKAPSCYQVQYMPGMVYNYSTMYPMSPIICSPLPVVPVPVAPHTLNPMVPEQIPNASHTTIQSNTIPERNKGCTKPTSQFQRPASQATSVKAEPGSGMGSIASASIANKAMSECSRKDLGLQSVCSPDTPLVSPPDGEITDMEIFNVTSKVPETVNSNQEKPKYRVAQDEESSYSSSYSSFFKTDTGSGSNDDSNTVDARKIDHDEGNANRRQRYPLRKRDPPWLETVSVTPELIYRYKMAVRGLEDILQSDLNTLKDVHQPILVNDQLNQLYVEMELEGLSTKLTLEEGITSSSSGEESSTHLPKSRRKRRSYSSLVMIYEENAPLPSPDNNVN